MANLNKRLKSAIFLRYGTQAAFADVLGVCETIVSKLVRGRRAGPPELREKIAVYLGMDEQELFPNLRKQEQQGTQET